MVRRKKKALSNVLTGVIMVVVVMMRMMTITGEGDKCDGDDRSVIIRKMRALCNVFIRVIMRGCGSDSGDGEDDDDSW